MNVQMCLLLLGVKVSAEGSSRTPSSVRDWASNAVNGILFSYSCLVVFSGRLSKSSVFSYPTQAWEVLRAF